MNPHGCGAQRVVTHWPRSRTVSLIQCGVEPARALRIAARSIQLLEVLFRDRLLFDLNHKKYTQSTEQKNGISFVTFVHPVVHPFFEVNEMNLEKCF